MTTSTLDRLVKAAVEQINKGSIKLSDLLNTLAPEPEHDVVGQQLPLPAQITPEQKVALERIGEVFAQVVPAERRKLSPAEVDLLVEEKELLDELKSLAERRWAEGIRVAVHNHLDVEAEEQGVTGDAYQNADGHWLVGGKLRGEPGTPAQFSREVRTSSPTITVDDLRALEDDPEVEFTHEDFLAMTSSVRVVDEQKLLLTLRKNPRLISAIAKAVRPGKKTAAIYLRKA